MRPTPFTAAAAGCALLLLSACGSSSDTDSGTGGTATEGPLSAYMNALYDIDYQKVHTQEQNLVAACMQEAGFEYVPRQVSADEFPDGEDELAWGEEYAEKNGYGYSTTPEPETEEAEPADPNAEYLAAMSESERAAYELALWGEQDDPLDDEAQVEWDWTKAGCQGEASNAAWAASPMAAFDDPAYADLQQEISRLYEKALADPKVTALNAKWAQCMSEAGYDFATVSEANDSFAERYSALWDAADPQTGTDQAAEAELRKEEVATAVADARCQTTVGYEETVKETAFALEREFVDAHQAELDAWVDQYATDQAPSK